MTTSMMTIDNDRCHMTEKILDLTLEIIYLLTGEEHYVVEKRSGKPLTPSSCLRETFPITENGPHRLTTEGKSAQKIVEVAKKMIGLLTGEVSGAGNSGTLSRNRRLDREMEEWEYLEGHKDLYKDVMMEDPNVLRQRQSGILTDCYVIGKEEANDEDEVREKCRYNYKDVMMEDQPLDGSRKRNPPERCPRPRDSQDTMQEDREIPQASPLHSQEHHDIPHHDQDEDVNTIKAEVHDSGKDSYMRGDEPCEEVEMPPEISTDGSRKRDSPERCLRSLDSTQEDLPIPHHDQFENDIEDEVYTTVYQQCKEEEFPIEISAAPVDECDIGRILQGHVASPPWDKEDDNITEGSPGEDQATPLAHPGLLRSQTSFILRESSSDTSHSLLPNSNLGLCGADWSSGPANPEETVHHKALRGNKLHLCSFCGKRFTTHANVVRHVRTHTGDRPYSCSLCGKSFTQKSILLNHQKVHTGDRPFPCPDCGKCFAKSSDVIRHRRVHTGERPYLCLQCGKSFTQKFRLRNHQHFHKEEEQSRRLECGWGLASKSNQFR